MAWPNSEQKELPKTATIHVANTMITNGILSYITVSVNPSIEINQQYDLVVL